MNVKLHILIILSIIGALFVIWQFFILQPIETKTVIKSGYSLQISRASYGLGCQQFMEDRQAPGENADSPYQSTDKQKDKLENNVLEVIKKQCEGQPECTFMVNKDTMGVDPYPGCGLKDLQVEFRCFAVDRIRRMSFQDRSQATINCDEIAG